MNINELTDRTIRCAIEVHRELGPGLLELSYEQCLSFELQSAGISHATQAVLPVEYKGLKIECGYRIDLLVEDRLIVEQKSVEVLTKVHEAQILNYLKLANIKPGC